MDPWLENNSGTAVLQYSIIWKTSQSKEGGHRWEENGRFWGQTLCLFYHQPPNVNHTSERGWRGSLNTFLVSALNTKWIKIFFPWDVTKTACPSVVSKMTFSSNEAECIGGRHAVAGTKQKSWGLGGAYIRDRIGWWRELCLKIDKEEKKGGGGE